MAPRSLFVSFVLALTTIHCAYAESVQQSACVGPAGAPVKAIYLHGWFQPGGSSNDFQKLESGNRRQLAELAAKLNIRIAIPLAPNINGKNGNREWPGGQGPAANRSLRSIESESERVCNSKLAPKRTLIGFSNGGFAARNIAMACDNHMRANYGGVIMMGAKPWANVSKNDFTGCPPLKVMGGTKDGLETCVKNHGCRSFEDVARDMKAGMGSHVSIERYPAGHRLVSNDRLAQLLGEFGSGNGNGNSAPPAVATAPAPVATPQPAQPAITGGTTGPGFMMEDPPAIK